MQREEKKDTNTVEDRQNKLLETFKLGTEGEARKGKQSRGASQLCTGDSKSHGVFPPLLQQYRWMLMNQLLGPCGNTPCILACV